MPLEELDPFVHMDQMGAVDYGPGEPKGTSWHPHRGFETVTYIIDGIFQHQDSHGGGGVITDGATQWMTAGGGILHIETPPEKLVVSGGLFHGLQLWVNLPAADKLWRRATRASRASRSPCCRRPTAAPSCAWSPVTWAVTRARARRTHRSPSSTPPSLPVPASNCPGAEDFNALVYVLSGSGRVGPDGRPVSGGQLVVFGAGDHLQVTADERQDAASPALEVIVLGGRPIGEPVAWYGPFVMNTKAEIATAVEDFQAGRFGVIPPGALMPYVVRD